FAKGDLGYVVQLEHIEYVARGNDALSMKDYRVTMVFRKDRGSWKIIHRQADGQLAKTTAS
ncbi:MAG TPA: nuclear transport factor 2 family protein, partial [Pyrinomonadaceae bacterium]|nr:nuclear transport factor 2 family protein [Pyrinomonadaceae bacterium]